MTSTRSISSPSLPRFPPILLELQRRMLYTMAPLKNYKKVCRSLHLTPPLQVVMISYPRIVLHTHPLTFFSISPRLAYHNLL